MPAAIIWVTPWRSSQAGRIPGLKSGGETLGLINNMMIFNSNQSKQFDFVQIVAIAVHLGWGWQI